MSQSFLSKFRGRRAWLAIVLPAWVLAGFLLAEGLVIVLFHGLGAAGVNLSLVNPNVLDALASLLVYVFALLIVIGLPWKLKKYRTTKADLALETQPAMIDFLLAPVGFVIYIVLSGILVAVAPHILPFVDLNQAQDTGFSGLTQPFEYVVAFLMLIVIAPVAEEVLFRGYLLGKLRHHVPTWAAILITSALFGLVHFNWSVSIDVFALSIVLCLLRVRTNRLWPGVFLHMIKNALAFYLLFINPALLSTLGG